MNLTVTNDFNNTKRHYQPAFKGPMDGVLTSTLRTLDTNEMANAVLLDLGAMVAPRTYIDTKKRNSNAGAETFFREICGTFINCLSAGVFAILISNIAAKHINPDVSVNPKSWFSDNSVKVLKNAWDNSDNNVEKYVGNVFENMSGQDGKKRSEFKNVEWNKVDWFEENKWKNLTWDNPNYKNLQDKLTTKNGFIATFSDIIKDKNITPKDKKQVFDIFETRLTNAFGVNRSVDVKIGQNTLNATMHNILRDTYDMGRDIFTNDKVNIDAALAKIGKINKIKIFGALSLASILGLTNQRLNRKITEKRTGKKGFAGDPDYETANSNPANQDVKVKKNKGLLFKKLLASAGMIAMTIGVMKVKSPKDFVKKLQFTGPISTGNAIKTVYASTIVGRFMAADSETELRESVTRDYFGFLNWLVLGGFAAKGVANILDKKQENLFNISKEGKGIKHWLNDISLKTHAEIASKGKEFAKKNIWKLNVAHIAGLAYSTVALGIILPLINIKMANRKQKVNNQTQVQNQK